MDLEEAQNTFAVRLYEWSQRDFFRELEEGCPLLMSIGLNDRGIAALVVWNETLTSAQRKELVVALTREFHENAARLKGETLTERDRFWKRTVCEHMLDDELVPPLLTAFKEAPGYGDLDADECLETLVASVPPELGRASRRGRSKAVCTKLIGDWKVVTEFTLYRRDEVLSFVYDFIRKDGGPTKEPHPAQGPFPRSLLLFYGIGGPWAQVPSRIDGDRMAKVIPRLAAHFVAQADPLFAGLGVAD